MRNPEFGAREPMRRVSAADPCPICNKPDWCGVSQDGRVAICMRTESAIATRNGGWLHHLTEPLPAPSSRGPIVVFGKNWHAEAERFAANLDTDRKRKLAASLNLPPDALDVLRVGFHPDDPAGPCFTFPEVNPAGIVVGISRRWKQRGGPDGKDKMMMKGGHRGLTLPAGWRERAGPLFVVEGPTDVCAMHAAGVACVGRPGANMGAEMLAELLRDFPAERDILVVGENDKKPDGKWPGRDGARVVARRLADALDRPVRWSLTPDSAKDPRAWFAEQAAGAGESADWTGFGRTLSAALSATATTVSPPAGSRDSGDASAHISGSGGWGPPAALPSMPGVPAFPLSAFPAKVGDYWRAAGEALACPVDYVAVPGLTLLGAAVGRSRAAEVKSGYAESPLFWSAVFAPPGGTKSPALRAARAPLQRAEARWLDEHRDRMTLFDTEMDRHAARVKDWKSNGCKGEPPEKPRKPTLRQATLDDTTVEATAKVLADNPHGVAVVKDELIGFVRGQNQYKGGRGADREFWLSAWAGATAKVNR